MSILIQPIDATFLDCYGQLSQHYEAEFSPLTGKTPNHQGYYEITPIDAAHMGYMARLADGTPIGFAVVNLRLPRFDIAEFYVIPTHRKFGYGRELAFYVFDRHPGLWQVRQIAGADKAHAFWVSVIEDYSAGEMTSGVEDDPEWGRVRIQRFRSRNATQVQS